MSLSRMNHVRKLKKSPILVFVCMIARLWTVASTTRYKDASIFCLNWTEPYRNIEIYIQKFPCLLIIFNIIKCEDALVKFEEVDPVCLAFIRISWEAHLSIIPKCSESSSHLPSERILCISVSTKCHTLSEHSTTSTIWPKHTIAMFTELRMNSNRRVLASVVLFFGRLVLLEENSLKFDIAIVEYKSFSHKLFQKVPIYRFKLRVLFETVH